MSAKIAHVEVAKREGAQAGFDMLHERLMAVTKNGKSGLPHVRASLDELHKVGGYRSRGIGKGTFKNPEKALTFYCNKYGINGTTAPAAVVAAPVATSNALASLSPEVIALLTPEQIVALAGTTGNTEVEGDDEPVAEEVEAPVSTPAPADTPKYAPSDATADEPATNGRLWKMNYLGLLTDDGSIITNAEAHEAIAEALS